MNEEELEVHRFNTRLFIEGDALYVNLRRSTKESDGEGGYVLADDGEVGVQMLRLIPQTDIMPQVTTPAGVQLTPSYVLMGEHDAEIPRWSRFLVDGVEFIVTSPMRPDHTLSSVYQRKADVARV